MKPGAGRAVAIIWLLFCLAGCTTVYWEKQWAWNALETVEEAQSICVESDPPASLWVDGVYMGETPLEIPFSYGVNEIRLIRRQIKSSGFGNKEVLGAESETRGFLQESAHTLHFRASGFHDRFLPLTIPRFEETVHVRLKRKIGPDFPVTVRLDVTALKEQFPLIRGIVQQYATVVNRKEAGYGVLCFIHVILERHEVDHVAGFHTAIQELPMVQECHHITGDYDYLLKVVAHSTDDLEDFLINRLTPIPGVARIHTSLVLSEVKSSTAIPLGQTPE